ncbi:MAG TPA: hypothetical protein VF155_08090 [Candidatus Dormibacteraeota bacterium]
MLEALPYIAGALGALAVWWLLLSRLGVFLPEDVRAWRRLAALRGHPLPETRFEQTVKHARWLRRAQHELDLDRLLARACRDDTELAFVGKSAALALVVFALCLLIDAAARAAQGTWLAPPWLAIVLGFAVLPISLLELRGAARRSGLAVSATLADMLMQVAVITDTRGLQLHDAVRMLARCAHDPSLARLVDQESYRRLAPGPHRSTVEMYRAIGSAYGIDTLSQLADAAASTNVGIPERQAFTHLALGVYAHRLGHARMRAARAKVLVTLPVAAMLIPLLLLIAAPTFQAVSGGLGGG